MDHGLAYHSEIPSTPGDPQEQHPEPVSTVSEPSVGEAHHEASLGSVSLDIERTVAPTSFAHCVKIGSESYCWEDWCSLKQVRYEGRQSATLPQSHLTTQSHVAFSDSHLFQATVYVLVRVHTILCEQRPTR